MWKMNYVPICIAGSQRPRKKALSGEEENNNNNRNPQSDLKKKNNNKYEKIPSDQRLTRSAPFLGSVQMLGCSGLVLFPNSLELGKLFLNPALSLLSPNMCCNLHLIIYTLSHILFNSNKTAASICFCCYCFKEKNFMYYYLVYMNGR